MAFKSRHDIILALLPEHAVFAIDSRGSHFHVLREDEFREGIYTESSICIKSSVG
jgi:hypothetical protein